MFKVDHPLGILITLAYSLPHHFTFFSTTNIQPKKMTKKWAKIPWMCHKYVHKNIWNWSSVQNPHHACRLSSTRFYFFKGKKIKFYLFLVCEKILQIRHPNHHHINHTESTMTIMMMMIIVIIIINMIIMIIMIIMIVAQVTSGRLTALT